MGDVCRNELARDLDEVLDLTRDLWEGMRGGRFFITGGTGFVGTWLLESLLWANGRLALGLESVVLSRAPDVFGRCAPHLAEDPSLTFVRGDVTSFDFPEGGFSHVVHAAAELSTRPSDDSAIRIVDTIVAGTRRVLDFACECGAQRLLLTSSGAVYGPQPDDVARLPEDHMGAPDPVDPSSAYAEGKRTAELLCALYQHERGLQTTIARCFAFVGPGLPLDAHFAIGNFIRDGIDGDTIRVAGDGTPVRSYLYAADLAVWLWTILMNGRPARPYNVGSEEEHTIADVARMVAGVFGSPREVEIAGVSEASSSRHRYVPSTLRARTELGLSQTTDLEEAVRRTVAWYSRRRP